MKKRRSRSYLFVIIGISLMFLFGKIPPFSVEITVTGMEVLGVFLGVIFLWSTTGEIIWPSLLSVLALGLTSYTDMNGAINAALGNPIIWQMMTLIALVTAIKISGAGEVIAKWLVGRRSLVGHPLKFSFVFLLAFLLVSAVSNGVAMMFLSWTVLEGIAQSVDRPMTDPYFVAMSIFSMAASAFGEFVIPLKGWQLALCLAFQEQWGQPMNYLQYILIAAFMGTAILAICVLAMKPLFKVDLSFLADYRSPELGAPLRLTKRQLTYLLTLIICLVLALFSSYANSQTFFGRTLLAISMPGIFTIGVVFLCVIRDREEKPILDFNEVMVHSNVWGPLFLVAAAIPLANALVSEKTGFLAMVSNKVAPVFGGRSAFVVIMAILLLSLILTNLASNTGIGLMMIPLSVPIAMQAGLELSVAATLVIYSVSLGFIFPGASALSAIMYASSHLTPKQIISHTGFICGVYVLLGMLVYPLVQFVL